MATFVDLTDWYLGLDGQWHKEGRGDQPPGSQAPGAPTGVHASMSGTTATVSWSAPATDGGSPVTGYRVATDGGTPQFVGLVLTTTVAGLTAGAAHTFAVSAVNDVGAGPSATVTVSPATAARFPGDTRPLLTGKLVLGVDEEDGDPKRISANEFFAPETAAGIPAGSMRRYFKVWSNFGSAGSARATTLSQHADGRICWASMNTGTWAAQITGANDAVARSWIAWCEEQVAAPVIFTIEHEPDVPSKWSGAQAQGTPAEWLAMQRWFRGLMDDYANAHGGVANYKWKNLAFAPIFTANGFANGNVDRFIPNPAADKHTFDFIGVDPYAMSHTVAGFTANFQKCLAWCKTYGFATGVGEWAVMNDDPDGAAKMQSMYDNCTNGRNDVFMLNYFNSGVQNNSMSQYWAIKNIALNGFMGNQFVKMMKDGRSLHYWDLTRPDGAGYPRPRGV